MAARRRWPEGMSMQLRSADDLDELIRMRGFNQTTLAEAVHRHRSMIGNLVNGKETSCSAMLAILIEDALKVKRGTLFVDPTPDSSTTDKPRRPYRRRVKNGPSGTT
jgi:predicted XRE-type DNA-binding protein